MTFAQEVLDLELLQLMEDDDRVGPVAVVVVEVGQLLQHVVGLISAHALEELPGLGREKGAGKVFSPEALIPCLFPGLRL